MKKFTRQIVGIALLFACSTFAQKPDTQNRYITEKETALSGSVEKVTIQVPTTGGKVVVMEGAWMYSSGACNFILSQFGTAATTTALTPRRVNKSPVATAQAFHTSNAGAGTAIATYTVAAGETKPISLSTMWIPNDGASTNNLSIESVCTTGTVRITFQHVER